MISVGIDVSKGKGTVCILKPYGEIVRSPFETQRCAKQPVFYPAGTKNEKTVFFLSVIVIVIEIRT